MTTMLPPPTKQVLTHFHANHLMRKRHLIEHEQDNRITSDATPCLHFCSNDYLSLTHHPAIKKALAEGALQYGLGSGASALISGYAKPHRLLEEAYADFLQRERALLFNSGYHANLGVLTTFANRQSVIIADKYCHASLVDGALLSRAAYLRYHHNDIQHAEALLKKQRKPHACLVTESVFSMQGDIANIKAYASLAARHGAMLLVDDGHGIGVMGEEGRGICEYFHLSQEEVPCLMTPLGKAPASMGAIVSGSEEMINALIQCARTYRYSTALPPAVCYATLTALTLMKQETWRRQTLQHLIQFFIKQAEERHLPLSSTDMTPIKSIIVGSNKLAVILQKKLWEQGLFVSCIRSPTVPMKAACLRISLNCLHTEAHILYLLDQLAEHFYFSGLNAHARTQQS